jgi:hypothetical protein
MLCVVQFDVRSSFTWRTAQYRHFGRTRSWRIQAGTHIPLVVSPSPLKQFRPRKILSVSDLANPAWYVYLTYLHIVSSGTETYRCEVQFDYGLRGKVRRPIEKRPKSFVSSSGKKISVVKRIAEKNEVTSKQGLVRRRSIYLSFGNLQRS